MVKPESEPALAEVEKLLARNPNMKVFVVGHTDTVGEFDYNMDLSRRRAAAVVEVLEPEHLPYRETVELRGGEALEVVEVTLTPKSRLGTLDVVTDADALPTYVHCVIGRDRASVAAALILAALGASEPAWSQAPPTPQRTLLRQVRGHGTLVPEELRWVQAQTTGRVDRVFVDPGQRVSADDVILELINPEVERAAVDAENALRREEAELERIFDRWGDGLEPQSVWRRRDNAWTPSALDAAVLDEVIKLIRAAADALAMRPNMKPARAERHVAARPGHEPPIGQLDAGPDDPLSQGLKPHLLSLLEPCPA